MPLEQSEAIVLRVYPWSETSCIATIYTREHGKLSLLAKGARRPKSPFEAALDLLSICRVVFVSKSSDALDILTEARLERRFRAASQDLLRLNCGYYVAELLDRLTDKGDKQPEIFDLADSTLADLDRGEREPRALILRFELQLLRMLGHLPSFEVCVHCGCDVRAKENLGTGRRRHRSLSELETTESSKTALKQALDPWWIFSVNAGGILCSKCRGGGRHLIRIHEEVRTLLNRFSMIDWQAIPMDQYTREHRPAIRKMMQSYLTALLERPLNLHAYLEELGR